MIKNISAYTPVTYKGNIAVDADFLHKGEKMKKIFIVIISSIFLFTSCDNNTDLSSNKTNTDIDLYAAKGYHYIKFTDFSDGLLCKSDGCLFFLDYSTSTLSPLCSDPTCEHNNKDCSAYYAGRTFVYNNKIIEIKNNDSWTQNEGFVVNSTITTSDLNGYNRKTSAKIRYAFCDTFAFEDKLYIGCEEGYYEEDDDLFSSPVKSRIYLMVLSLSDYEVEYTSDCLVDGFYSDIQFCGIYNDEIYFNVGTYNEMQDIDIGNICRNEMTYNINSGKISSVEKKSEYVSEDLIVNFDGNSVKFVTPTKTAELTSEIFLPYMPLDITFSDNKEIYFVVSGNPCSIFKFNYDTELLYEAKNENWDYPKIISVTDDLYILEGEKTPLVLSCSEIAFHEIDMKRYDEICMQNKISYT